MSETKKYLKNSIIRDIENLADEPIFDNGKNPKEEIDKLIDFAKENDIIFWDIVKSNCSPYELERLKYIYEGKDLDELDKKTFNKSEEEEWYPKTEYNPYKDGIKMMSFHSAKKMFDEKGEQESKYYFVVYKERRKRDVYGLIDKETKIRLKSKNPEMYLFYSSFPCNTSQN